MRIIEANRQVKNFKECVKGTITNDIYDCSLNLIGYEVKIGDKKFKNILIENYNINIKEVSVL